MASSRVPVFHKPHYTSGMNQPKSLLRGRKLGLIVIVSLSLILLSARYFYIYGQDKSGFPDGFDAVQVAPNSHKVVFENEFVRVLEVTMMLTPLLGVCIG